MLAVTADVTVKPGAGPEFESVVADLVAQVRANEPGNHIYQLTRSQADPNNYRFFEIYSDRAALEAHTGSDHFRAAGKLMTPLLAAPPRLEFFDTL
ncbi:putative quinol monooxygenase [Nocardia sp. NPDC050630]|jgi:quinol monooxygenase YgiN|uniref:putative quinol monooxygenase n=1 Tax=Nocardia sp. NPDC050630 TaxID=3364321 RepID=UPI00378AD1E4